MNTITIPARIAAAVKNARLPANYEAAKRAIAECSSIDECLDWADTAAALASYARQVEDVELEHHCRRIRARASRRCGELLKSFDARGRHMKKGNTSLSRTEAARAAGMTNDQRKTAIRLVRIPHEVFEVKVESPRPPGTSLLAKLGRQTRPKAGDAPRNMTSADLHALMDGGYRLEIIDALVRLARRECDLRALVEILLKPENEETLNRVKRALVFTRRIEAALNAAGVSIVTHLKPVTI